MDPNQTLRDVVTILGGALGVAALVLSLANYFRDRPRLRISLQFDMEGYGGLADSGTWLVASLANTGRRPIFVSHVGLCRASYWKRYRKDKALTLLETAEGRRLQEGDPPWTVPGKQDETVTSYVNRSGKVRAFASDSAGKTYYSRPARPK